MRRSDDAVSACASALPAVTFAGRAVEMALLNVLGAARHRSAAMRHELPLHVVC